MAEKLFGLSDALCITAHRLSVLLAFERNGIPNLERFCWRKALILVYGQTRYGQNFFMNSPLTLFTHISTLTSRFEFV